MCKLQGIYVSNMSLIFLDITFSDGFYFWSEESGKVYSMHQNRKNRKEELFRNAASIAFDPLAETLYYSQPENNRVNRLNIPCQ